MNECIKYAKKHLAAICTLLQEPDPSFTPEQIHQIRVEIKKLNSVFHLIQFCDRDFNRKKAYKSFRTIFLQAGRLRELHIQSDILQRHFSQATIANILSDVHQHLSAQEDLFCKMLNDKKIARLKSVLNRIIPFLLEIDQYDVDEYCQKKMDGIEKMMRQKSFSEKHLHKLRKRMKYLNYAQQIYKHQSPGIAGKWSDLPRLIGEWHDYVQVMKHLKKSGIKNGSSLEEKGKPDLIMVKMKNESESILIKIKESILSFLHQNIVQQQS